MTLHYADDSVTLHHGDCLDVLATMPDCSIDAIVTDPPYLLGFMGRDWDTRAAHEHLGWHRAWCDQAFRVLKPGGHMLAFGGTRTAHRLACAIEDSGFEIRDTIAWLYGSGFPKSLDVSKAIDKAAGAERLEVRQAVRPDGTTRDGHKGGVAGTALAGSVDGALNTNGAMSPVSVPATPEAERWQGWGTALKPANEPIIVARKAPVGTVAANVLTYGTGALNIDGCRTPLDDETQPTGSGLSVQATSTVTPYRTKTGPNVTPPAGRWPTNVVLDPDTAAQLDAQTGTLTSGANPTRRSSDKFRDAYGDFRGQEECTPARGADSGGASRFFPTFRYEAKAPTDERPRVGDVAHPTVKPLDLMRWLVRLVTQPGGLVLDLFAGSGATGEACIVEGFRCILIEREADYIPLILARITKPIEPVLDFGEAS